MRFHLPRFMLFHIEHASSGNVGASAASHSLRGPGNNEHYANDQLANQQYALFTTEQLATLIAFRTFDQERESEAQEHWGRSNRRKSN